VRDTLLTLQKFNTEVGAGSPNPATALRVLVARWLCRAHATSCRTTWFTQDACTGVCTMTAFGNRRVRRSIAARPRWEDPLSTTQNTRFADAYGSQVMTCSTNTMTGTIPVEAAHPPNTRARCTS
jgi:type II secretory pathway pseudopilin PulG